MQNIDAYQVTEKIVERTIDPPKNMTAHELTDWLNGYATCQKDILTIIQLMVEGQQD